MSNLDKLFSLANEMEEKLEDQEIAPESEKAFNPDIMNKIKSSLYSMNMPMTELNDAARSMMFYGEESLTDEQQELMVQVVRLVHAYRNLFRDFK